MSATISCPDCGHTTSFHAQACPHCGRPEPGKSIQQIEADYAWAGFGLLWFGNALFAWINLGFWWGVTSLFIGPLVWVIAP